MFFCGFVGMFMFFCAHWQTYVSGTLRFGLWVQLFMAYSTEIIKPVCVFFIFFFLTVLLLNGFCRVDVTEVQIAIVIMYIMTAFGGVSLWETRVRHSPSLTEFSNRQTSECLSHNIDKFIPIIITERVYTKKVHFKWKTDVYALQSYLFSPEVWNNMILLARIILWELTASLFDIYLSIFWLLHQSQLMFLAY